MDYKPNKKELEAQSLVMDRFHTYLDYAKPNYFDKWDEYWRQYNSILENESNYPYRAKLFIPYSFTAVETTIPRVMEAIFSSEPIIAAKPQNEDDVENTKTHEQVLNYQIKKMDYFDTSIFLLKDACVIGNCFEKIAWRRENRKKRTIELERDGMGNIIYETDEAGNITITDGKPTPKYKKVQKTIQTYNDPYIWYVDPYKILIDPKASPVDPISTAEAVILITESTIDKLKDLEKQGIYKNIRFVEDVKGSTKYEEGKTRYSDSDIKSPQDISDKHSRRVLLYEYWEDDRIIVLAEEKIVIRDEPNPYDHMRKPFVMARTCPMGNQICGKGLMEMIGGLQNELNDVRNQRMDNLTLALNRMYIVAKDADIDLGEDGIIPSTPGGVIQSNYPGGIIPLEMPNITGQAFKESYDIVENIEETLGNYNYSRGKESSSRETATGILSLQEVANIRFKMMIMILCRSLVGKAAALMADLNEQYITDDKVIRLTGTTFEKIPVDEIVGRYDYEPVGASLEGLSKYARLEQLLRFRQVFSTNELFDLVKFDKELLDLLNFKNAGDYFKQPMPPPEAMGTMPGMGMPMGQGEMGRPPAMTMPGLATTEGMPQAGRSPIITE